MIDLIGVTGIASIPWILFGPGKAGDVLLTCTATAAWIFALIYLVGSKWWISTIGRAMFFGNLFFAFILTQNTLSVWTDQSYPFRAEIRTILYAALLYSGGRLIKTLWEFQNYSPEPDNETDKEKFQEHAPKRGPENDATT